MTLKRRLQRLECRPFLSPFKRPKHSPEIARALQKRLALPLPEYATEQERAAALVLLKAAQAKTRIDISDTSGVDQFRDYALKLHTKYGTDPYWGQPD